ncbi:MAG TPA: DNA polymerase III subunit gamma/tau [Myxococcota bacterium]|nr:DNA polymerase III subunit gamma/tau [Myxococcota bacterium]
MSYQAIARKWRPGTFEEICGQGHVTQTLQNALRLERIHHAFLFTGARGVGKTTAARTFARALNCAEGPTPTPCGECSSCKEISGGGSTDVIEIDGASNNSVEDVRSLRDAVRYLPARDRYRIYIIDEVHMLSIGAFNALLKTLEEPPAHVLFIFATTEPQKIPDTILSRVQRFDFKRIPSAIVVERLAKIAVAEGADIGEDGLKLIARAGEGSMRDAQSLLDQVIAFSSAGITTEEVARVLGLVDRGLLYGFLEGLVAAEPDRCLDAISAVYDYGYELSQFTTELLELLRNAALTVLSPGARKHIDAPAEELERLAVITRGTDAETFSRWFAVMLQIHDEVSRSSRPRLVLEMAVARLASIRPLKPVDQLVVRLEELEKKLAKEGYRPRKSLSAMAAEDFVPAPPDVVPPTPPAPPDVVPPAPPEVVSPPPKVDKPGPVRFQELLASIPKKASFRPVLENAAFLRMEAGVVHLAVPGDTHLTKAQRIRSDAELQAAVMAHFGVGRVEFELRAEHVESRTTREARDLRREAWKKKLWESARNDPAVAAAEDVLGTKLVDVELPLFEED